MKVLILVMSARREPWGALMDAQMETWDAEDHPQTETLYYVGKCPTCLQTSQVFSSLEFTEELEDISPRTIEAFEKSLDYEWEYMARVHSSTYVHKDNLVKFCHTLPRHKVIRGVMTGGDKPFMWGGCHYIYSRDVIDSFVRNKDKWNTKVMEDGSITELCQKLDLPLTSEGWSATIDMDEQTGIYTCLLYNHGESFTFYDFADISRAEGHFFFRCKQDLRRHEDVRIMRELKKHLT